MKRLSALFLFGFFTLAGASSPSMPEDMENSAFDPKKVPILEEKPPSTKFSKAEWAAAIKASKAQCGERPAWKISDKSTIGAAATKEKNVPVKGKFTRFTAFAYETGSSLKGSGDVDLSSWDSTLPARDYRIQKYIFNVEKKGMTVLPFKFDVEKWDPKQGSWQSTLNLEFVLNKAPHQLDIPVKISVSKGSAQIASVEPKRFTFLSALGVDAFNKLMTLCNHHVLGTYADVSLDLAFEPACP